MKERLVVHAGGVIRILAFVSGKPAPQITWNRDDGALPEEATIETTAISSSLVIKKCTRKHKGIYTLTAKNDGGEKKKSIVVDVLGTYSVNYYSVQIQGAGYSPMQHRAQNRMPVQHRVKTRKHFGLFIDACYPAHLWTRGRNPWGHIMGTITHTHTHTDKEGKIQIASSGDRHQNYLFCHDATHWLSAISIHFEKLGVLNLPLYLCLRYSWSSWRANHCRESH